MIDIKTIWANQTPTDEIIIKTRIVEIHQFKCFAATNHITGNHLFVLELAKETQIPEFKHFKFKGLIIQSFDFDCHKELNIYLLDNHLKDIFSLFIENIFDEIKTCITENEALVETSNVVIKWKKLFDKIDIKGLTLEGQKGLIGELLLFNTLLDNNFPVDKILEAWTGPSYEDKDFLFGDKGIEVKFTSSKNPKIKITSERQLDDINLSQLFILLYTTEQVKNNGFSLNSIIDEIRNKILTNKNALKKFNDMLCLVGYFEDDYDNYNSQYAIKEEYKYLVSTRFPRIVSANLPIGIFNASYSIDLSAIDSYIIDTDSLFKLIS